MEGTMVKIRSDVITEEALVITCFPSVGMVSSVVGHFLIDNLELEFVGGVVDPRLPPSNSRNRWKTNAHYPCLCW